jgi:riboflavin synthase alpha subunit
MLRGRRTRIGSPAVARDEVVAEKGFYILPSELFANVRKRAAQDENLNETLERTVLGSVEVGARVNLEVDVLAKYVEKLAARTAGA